MRWLCALLVLLVSLPALAATVQLSVPLQEVRVGQSMFISVQLVNGSAAAVPRIEVPSGLRVSEERQEQNTHKSIRNGRVGVEVTRSFVYRLTALSEGTYTLGPVPVEVIGKGGSTTVMNTGSVQLVVSPRPEQDSAAFVAEAGFDVTQAWEGQVVVYRVGLKSRVRVLRKGWSFPEFEGLVAPRDGNRPQRATTLTEPDGTRVDVEEVWFPFVVTGTGTLDQPPTVVRVDLPSEQQSRSPFAGLFMNTRTEVFATEPAELASRPLPPPPEGFSGLVGDFEFTSHLDKTTAAVGESANWTVRVTGNGTLEGFSLPQPQDLDWAQVYDNGPSVRGEVLGGRYTAVGDFLRVVVPTAEGVHALPDLPIIVFSPSEGRYVTKRVPGGTLEVTPGTEGAAVVESFGLASSGPTEHAAEDIRPPRTSGRDTSPWLGGWMRGLLPMGALPGLLLLGVIGRERFAQWTAERQAAIAPTPAQRLAQLPNDPAERLAVLDGALREAVGQAALDDATAVEVDEVQRALNRARFAGSVATDIEERVRQLVLRLEAAA